MKPGEDEFKPQEYPNKWINVLISYLYLLQQFKKNLSISPGSHAQNEKTKKA